MSGRHPIRHHRGPHRTPRHRPPRFDVRPGSNGSIRAHGASDNGAPGPAIGWSERNGWPGRDGPRKPAQAAAHGPLPSARRRVRHRDVRPRQQRHLAGHLCVGPLRDAVFTLLSIKALSRCSCTRRIAMASPPRPPVWPSLSWR